MDTSRYKTLFLQESGEHLSGIEKELLTLDKNPSDHEAIDGLFRHYHSIKGMCASMGYMKMKDFAHAQEDLLDRARSKKEALTKEMLSVIFESLDMLKSMLRSIEEDSADGANPDILIKKIRELIATAHLEKPKAGTVPDPPCGWVPRPAEQSRAVESGLSPKNPDIAAISVDIPRFMKVDGSVFDELLTITGDLLTSLSGFKILSMEFKSIGFKERVHVLEKTLDGLRANILSARMLSFDNITQTLPRIVRDISMTHGKEADISIEGGDIALDRAILTSLGDPLVHIIRNAIDHGIETPDERIRSNKPRKGAISVSVVTRKDRVVVEVKDDGRGIEVNKLKERAVSKGVSKDKVAAMGDKEALMLVCIPGITLKDSVTDVSGRGVGMDIVKSVVTGLGGTLKIDTSLGNGTTIEMELPRTISIIKVLLVSIGGELLSIPLSKIEKVIEVKREEISGQTILYGKESIPVSWLKDMLTLPAMDTREGVKVVVIERDGTGRDFVGLIVDDVKEEFEAFIHPLTPPFSKLRTAAGYTILGDGRPVFLLDVSYITSQKYMV